MNNIIRSFGEFVTSKCFSFCLEKDCGSPLSDRTLFTFHMEWHMGQTSFRVQYISRELTTRFFCYFESHAPSLSHLDTNRDTWEPIIYREEERDELLLFGFSFLLLYYMLLLYFSCFCYCLCLFSPILLRWSCCCVCDIPENAKLNHASCMTYVWCGNGIIYQIYLVWMYEKFYNK